jgi:hypothetical protein
VAIAVASTRPPNAHQSQDAESVSADSPAAEGDGDGLVLGDVLTVTDRVTVDGLEAAVTVWVAVVAMVTSRVGDREGFCVADRVAVGSSGVAVGSSAVAVGSREGVGSAVGRLGERSGLDLGGGVGLGISVRVSDLDMVGTDSVGVGS